MDSPAPLESPVGILQAQVPAWAAEPPIEAVVFAWGASEDHQLGGDGSEAVWSPKVVESLLGVRFRGREFRRTPLIAGSRNTLAIDAEGQAWSWGWNARGTLGHGHRSAERKPRMVAGLQGVKIVQAALGGWHCLALDDAGQVHAWGGNEYAQCDEQVPARDLLVPQPCMPQLRVAQVACGGMSSMVLTTGGDVWTWGEPWGDFTLDMSRTPRQVQGAVDIAAIAAGGFHNMALNRAGEVLTWGTNDYGQLGNGSTSYSMEPSKVVDLEEVPISDIAAGGWHSVALAADGSIIVWGRGEYGRLGIRDRTGSSKLRPFKVLGMEGHVVVQVAAGGTHTMALTSEGRMFVWGRASYGRLGLGERARDVYEPEECVLPGGHDRWKIAAITCGGRHSMCLAVPMRDVAVPGVLVNGVEGEVDLSAAAASSSGGAGGGGEEPTAPIRSPGRMGSVTMRPSASFGSLRDAAMAAAAVPPAASSSSSGGAAAPSPGASSGGAAGAGNATQYPTSRFAAAAAAAGASAGGAGVTGGSPGSDSAALSGSASRASSGRAPSSPSTRSTSAGAGLASTLVSVGSGSLGRTNSSVAAMAAAAAAAGGRVSTGVRSPVMGGSAGSNARAFDGEAAAWNLGAGEQAPMSPRAYPPPMSPSQSRARHGGLVSSLADYPSFSGGFGGGNMEEEEEEDGGGGSGGGGGEAGDGAQGADSYEEDVQGVDEAGDEEDPAANPGATRGSLGQLVGSAAWQEGGAGFLLLQQHQQQQAKELLLRATSGSAAGGQGMPRSPSRNALAQIASFGSFTEYEQAMAGAGSPSRASSVAGPSRGGATTDSSRAPSAGGASPPGPLLTSPPAAAAAAAAGGSGTDPRQAWQGLGGVPNLPPVATGAPVADAAAGGRSSSSRASGSGPELSGSGSGARVSAAGAADLARAGSGTSSYSGHMGSGSGTGIARLHSGSIRVGSPSVLEPEEAAAALEAHQQQLRQQQEQQAQNLAQEGLHPRVALLLRSESTHENLNVPEAEEVSRQNSAGGASPSGTSPREGHGSYDVGMSEAESRPGRNLHSHLS